MQSGMTGRVQAWWGGVVATVATGALTWYLVTVGLDEASKLAGVLGLFVALAGLGATIAGLRRGDASASGQSVHGSTVGGGVVQVEGARNVRIEHRGAVAPPPPAASGRASGQASGRESGRAPAAGQTVSGSQVTGPVDQVRGVQGDVEIGREP